MSSTAASEFRRAALASGLVTEALLAEAESLAQASGGSAEGSVADEQLAAMLVGMGRLNQWQAEQLKAGRVKFNLGRYQILDSIGQGGMGQVFKAEDTLLGRVVAVKVLPRYKSTPDAIANFNREIRTHAQLDHENLVRAYDAGQDGNVYFMVTEYVPGADLRKLVRSRGPLNMRESASVISQAAKGLSYAHASGLVHRDVKPGNLLVTPGGVCKLSDLGLAALLDSTDDVEPPVGRTVVALDDNTQPNRAGRTVGTADYLSPEHILTPAQLTPASDVYSLGCTLYYAVTGKVPFPGGNARSKAKRHCHDAPLNPRLINADLDQAFLDVLLAMMEKDPARRIATAEDVVVRLAPWVGDKEAVPLAEIGERVAGATHAAGRDGGVGDTQTDMFDPVYSTSDESTSQMSQGTDPHASYSRSARTEQFAKPVVADVQVPLKTVAVAILPIVLAAIVLLAGLALTALR